LVEVFKDRALGLPPLNATLARRVMERTRIFTALKGVRGRKAADIAALEQIFVRFSQLVVEQPWIAEIDINPLLVSADRIFALDGRVVLHDPRTREDKLPHPAIRPYPVQYATPWKLKNQTPIIIRPIRPEDEPLMVKFHETLSPESVYHRYFSELKLSQRVAHERLTRICFNDYDREIALVAELKVTKPGNGRKIIGVGRLSKMPEMNEAEFAVLVSDEWHEQGLGTELLRRLVEIGQVEKVAKISGQVLAENHAMQHICGKLGFEVVHDTESNFFNASYTTEKP
jgi:acetyltransferase